MRLNRHDTWERFSEKHQDMLARTGLPTTVTRSEQRFRELIEVGRVVVSEAAISLRELTATEWSALFQFTAVFFQEFESYAPEDLFPAFRREIQLRGEEFPR